MNVLFYVEPLTECDKPTWKAPWINFVGQMISSLESASSQMQYCCVVGDGLADVARAKLPRCSVVVMHHVELVPRFGESALAAALHWYRSPSARNLNEMAELLVNHLEGFNPDVCICFAPAPFLAVAFPGLPVLHFELGLVSRAPFPPTAYLDPLGMFNHSYPMQNKDELRSYSATDAECDLVEKIRHVYLPRISRENPLAELIKSARADFSSAILVALQFSQFYGYDAHAQFPDQYDLVIQTLSSVPSSIAVVVVEHPQHQMLQKETVDYLRASYKNFIWFSEFREVPSASHYLLEYVDMVVTVSSSVGLQAMLWKKHLIVLGHSQLDVVADSHSLKDISRVMQEPYPTYKENVLAWHLSRYSMPFNLLFNDGVFLSCLHKAKVCADTGDYSSYFDLPFADISQIASAYLEGSQIVSLMKKEDSPDEQIAILNQAVDERDEQIDKLGQVLAERDVQLSKLNEAVEALSQEVLGMKASRSWRVTRPLRFIGGLVATLTMFTLERLAPWRKLSIHAGFKRGLVVLKKVTGSLRREGFWQTIKKIWIRFRFRKSSLRFSSVPRRWDDHIRSDSNRVSSKAQKKLTLISMIKNEKGLIETFAAHALAMFDRVIFVDHQSSDGSGQYLKLLAETYPQVEYFLFDDPGYYQSEVMTWVARSLVEQNYNGWIFFLDADEYLPFSSQTAFMSELEKYSAFPVISMAWLNLVPMDMEKGEVRGAVFLKPPQTATHAKIAFQPGLLPFDDYVVAQGNHAILIGGGLGKIPPEEAFSIYHIPIRTKQQLRDKIHYGVESYKEMGSARDETLGSHWDEISRLIECNDLSHDLMADMIARYGEPLVPPFGKSIESMIQEGYGEMKLDICTIDPRVPFYESACTGEVESSVSTISDEPFNRDSKRRQSIVLDSELQLLRFKAG